MNAVIMKAKAIEMGIQGVATARFAAVRLAKNSREAGRNPLYQIMVLLSVFFAPHKLC